MRTTIMRATAVAVGAAVALSFGISASNAQAVISAPAGADPAPAASGAQFLAAAPDTSGIIQTYYEYPAGVFDNYSDYGLTIDAAYALAAVGGQASAVETMRAALEANIGSYVFGGGSAAKLSAFLLSQGSTGTSIDDLVDYLETHISVEEGLEGRLVDEDDPGTPYDDDFNSPLTQAYAASALHTAASPLAASALSFMLDQQCAAGFFRSSFSAKAAPDQTCDGAVAPTPNVDTTGLSVLMLADQSANLEVQSGITGALDWLVSQQESDGSFNNGNANSTGLAGWALGLSGRTGPAAKAAGWLRAHQLANAGSCAPYAAKDNGAVMLDDLGYAGAASGPLDPVEQSVATRATAQSLPALLWAAGGANAGETVLTGPSDFVAAGTTQEVSILGAPGNTVCFTAGGVSSTVVLDESGAGSSAVTMPSKSRTVSVGSVDAGGETDTVSITGLAKKTLKVSLAKVKVKKGSKVVVKIRGLAPGESVKGKVGAKSAKTTANRKGRATLRIVAKKVAKTKVIAVGEFTNRRGKVFVTVIR